MIVRLLRSASEFFHRLSHRLGKPVRGELPSEDCLICLARRGELELDEEELE